MAGKPDTVLEYEDPQQLPGDRPLSRMAVIALGLSLCPFVMVLLPWIGRMLLRAVGSQSPGLLSALRASDELVTYTNLAAVILSLASIFRVTAAMPLLRGWWMSVIAFVISLVGAGLVLVWGTLRLLPIAD